MTDNQTDNQTDQDRQHILTAMVYRKPGTVGLSSQITGALHTSSEDILQALAQLAGQAIRSVARSTAAESGRDLAWCTLHTRHHLEDLICDNVEAGL